MNLHLAAAGAVIGAVVLAGPAQAQQQAIAPVFTALEGSWIAEGKAFGSDAVTRMEWTPVLGGRFHRVTYRIEMKAANGRESVFEGVGHYQTTGAASARGYWADNGGELHPLKSTLTPEVITTV